MTTGSESNKGGRGTRIKSFTEALRRARKIAAYSSTTDVPF